MQVSDRQISEAVQGLLTALFHYKHHAGLLLIGNDTLLTCPACR